LSEIWTCHFPVKPFISISIYGELWNSNRSNCCRWILDLAPPPFFCFLTSNLSSLCVEVWGFADISQQVGGMWSKFQGPKMLVLHKLIVVSWLYGKMCHIPRSCFLPSLSPWRPALQTDLKSKNPWSQKKVHEVKNRDFVKTSVVFLLG
jgi:hypothetical protein